MTSSSASTGFEDLHVDPIVAEAAALAARGEGHGSLNEAALFGNDDFRMYCLKIMPCAKRFTHDWVTCNFCHSGEKAKRRDPRFMTYTGIACPFMKKAGACPHGDKCPYAHNVFEYWLHPTRYRTQLCNDGMDCTRRVCFFAHSTAQLRVPAAKPFVAPEVLATLESGSPSALQNPSPAVAEGLRHISDSWQPGTRGSTDICGQAVTEANGSCLTTQEVEARVMQLTGRGMVPEVAQQLRADAPSAEQSLQGRLAAALQALQSSEAPAGDDQEQMIEVLQVLLRDALLAQQQQHGRGQQPQLQRVAENSGFSNGIPCNSTDNTIGNGNGNGTGTGSFQGRLSSDFGRRSSISGSSQDASPHTPSAVGLQQAAVQQAQVQLLDGMGSWSPGAAMEPQGPSTGWRFNNGGMLPQLVEHRPVLQQATNGTRLSMEQLVLPQNGGQQIGLHPGMNGQGLDHVIAQSYRARRSLQHDVRVDEATYPRRRSLQAEDMRGSVGTRSQPTTPRGDLWFGLPEQRVLGLGHGTGHDIFGGSMAGSPGDPSRMPTGALANVAHCQQQQQRRAQLLFQQGQLATTGMAGNGINSRTQWLPQNGNHVGSLVGPRSSLDSVYHRSPYWQGGPLHATSEAFASRLSLDVNSVANRAKSVASGGPLEFSGSAADLAPACNTFSDPGLGRKQTQSLPVDASALLREQQDAAATMRLLSGLSHSTLQGRQPTVGS